MQKTVLISGAGRGLGRSTAEAFHRAGFQVFASDINLNLLSDLQGKDGFMVFEMDVSSEASVRDTATQINSITRRLDVIVSNAGIFDFFPVSEAGSEKLVHIFEVNVFGLANLTKYFLPAMVQSKSRLVVISSESYKVPSPFQPYAISKQALEKLYDGISIELSTKGITTILIRPGAIQTRILEDTIQFESQNSGSVFEKTFEAFLRAMPKYIGKVSPPDKVARMILKAATAKNPKNVYHINHNPLVSLLSGLPAGIRNRLVQKNLQW